MGLGYIGIHGAVAQLGERRVRNAEVGSSILLGSTNLPGDQCPLAPKADIHITGRLLN